MRFKTVKCGPECENCEPDDRRGIAVVTQLDYFGDAYPNATSVILHEGEWIISALAPDAPYGSSVVARYPKDKVVGFRICRCETQLYVHHVDLPDEDDTE